MRWLNATFAARRIAIELGRLDTAAEHGNRLAKMGPFDADAQRLVTEVCLRHGEAHRRWSVYRKKLAGSFGGEPGLDPARGRVRPCHLERRGWAPAESARTHESNGRTSSCFRFALS